MADQFTGRTIAEKYRVESYLGNGEMGGVYYAVHLFTEQPVTINILPLELSKNKAASDHFFEEAKASFKLAHPNLLNVTDFGTDAAGYDYAVYEPITGESLADILERDGRLPISDAIEIAHQSASALSAAHAGAKLHGDLSPKHLMITAGPNTKVLGFGSANAFEIHKDIIDAEPSELLYASPEQCTGTVVKSEQSDVYSLGVILFEMIAGEPPFSGDKPTDVILKQIEEPPPPLVSFRKDIPKDIEPVVLKAIAKNPEMRYQTAQEFADDLSELSNVHGETAVAAAAGSNFWKTAFIALIGIGLLAAAMIYATSGRKTDPITQLKPDENGIPVQPISPPTGVEEQNLASMPGAFPDAPTDGSMPPPGTLPGGDGYNAWGSGSPPPGAPPSTYVPPGGQVYTIDPNNPSQFMPNDSGVILVPIPANTQPKPSPTPKASSANTAPAPEVKPAATPKPAPTKPPTVDKPPTAKPEKPKTKDSPGEPE